jgi:maltose alpha-D-glucosyltransferase/alpha-amylase
MQWSDGRHGGFSTSRSKELPVPIISDGPFAYTKVNVEQQAADPDSLLNTVKRLIHMRRRHGSAGRGRWHIIDTEDPHVLVHRCIWEQDTLLAIHNFTDKTRRFEASLADQAGRTLVGLTQGAAPQPIGTEPLKFELPPYGYRWYEIQGTRNGA